jgi:hypothetical protein
LEDLELQERVSQALETLNPVEKNVIRLRYLFDGNKQPKQEDVSGQLQLGNQSAVSLLERKALSTIYRYISDHQLDNSSESAPASESAPFSYTYSKDDCDFARILWGIPDKTVHHRIADIWRCMAPYPMGKVIQILIQAECITPRYAVKTLRFGDK